MNKQKEFDCVEMKRQVQERVRLRYAGIPDEGRAALGDPILGPFLTKLRSRRPVRPGQPAVR